MNLILYILMIVTGFLGCLHELMFNRNNWYLLFASVVFFVLTMCSCVGSFSDITDLASYIDFFIDGNETYFEPGYVWLTSGANYLFGNSPYVLLTTVNIWDVSMIIFAAWLCHKLSDNYVQEKAEMITFFPATLFFIVSIYWGSFFGSTVLRFGMAATLLYSACVFSIYHKPLYAIVVSLAAMLFHLSAIIFLLAVILISFIKDLSFRQYTIWFFVVLVFDVVLYTTQIYTTSFIDKLFETITDIEMMSHYTEYSSNEGENYFSTQYLSYHLFGFLMLFGNLNNSQYNRTVMFYFVGLTIGCFFQSAIIVMRVQWLFLTMIVLVAYFFLKDDKFSLEVKLLTIGGFVLIQSVMALRVLGWHV